MRRRTVELAGTSVPPKPAALPTVSRTEKRMNGPVVAIMLADLTFALNVVAFIDAGSSPAPPTYVRA